MESSDADSYRYHVEETQVVFTGSGTAVLVSDYMPVVPTVITTAETTMSWKNWNRYFPQDTEQWHMGNSRAAA